MNDYEEMQLGGRLRKDDCLPRHPLVQGRAPGQWAGLSWQTIIDREENYRAAFDGFDPEVVASYDEERITLLMQNPGIIRNRLKIRSVVTNAKAFLKVQEEFSSFDAYIWAFTDGKVIDHHLKSMDEMPATSPLSEEVSRDLKKRGFKFVGPSTISSIKTPCFRGSQETGKQGVTGKQY